MIKDSLMVLHTGYLNDMKTLHQSHYRLATTSSAISLSPA